MPVRTYVEKNRVVMEAALLAVVLPAIAGAINATGFFLVGTYTSHITGMVAHIGDELAQKHFQVVWPVAGWLAAFLGGAMVGTALVELGKNRGKGQYVWALSAEAVALSLCAVQAGRATALPQLPTAALTYLLCFAMGLQNAMVTRLSGAVVRTTHLTGIMTDIGIEAVQATVGRNREASLRRLRLLSAIFISFFLGATVGPFVYLTYGGWSMFLPVAALWLLTLFDWAFGLTGAAPVPASVRERAPE